MTLTSKDIKRLKEKIDLVIDSTNMMAKLIKRHEEHNTVEQCVLFDISNYLVELNDILESIFVGNR